MKFLKFNIAIFTVLICFFNSANASHLLGGEIYYNCIGDTDGNGINEFEIKVDFIRDIFGISAPENIQVYFESSSCNSNFNLFFDKTDSFFDYFDQNTANCNFPSNFEYIFYADTIEFPMSCVDWEINTELGARSDIISNINNPGSEYLLLKSVINTNVNNCSTSLQFEKTYPRLYCVEEPVSYSPNVSNVIGDSVAFTVINPLSSYGTVYFSSGYSANMPVSALANTYSFNNTTGEIIFTPSQIEACVITTLVEQFDNNVLINSTVREQLFLMLDCNNIPQINNISNISTNATILDSVNLSICENDTLRFEFVATDLNLDNSLAVQIDTVQFNNAVVTYTSSNNPLTVFFEWTANNNFIGNNEIIFTVSDNQFGFSCQQTQSIFVEVIDNLACMTSNIEVAEFNNVKAFYSNNSIVINNLSFINNVDLTVLDLNGKILKSIQNINNQEVINVSDFNNGVYFVRFSKENFNKVEKIFFNR